MACENLFKIFQLLAVALVCTKAQWQNGYPNTYVTYSPTPSTIYYQQPTYNPSTYYQQQPTFSDLNSYTTVSPYLGQRVRIWPYVMGQYYYPYYNQYFSNYNGAYDTSNYNSYYNAFLNRGTTRK